MDREIHLNLKSVTARGRLCSKERKSKKRNSITQNSAIKSIQKPQAHNLYLNAHSPQILTAKKQTQTRNIMTSAQKGSFSVKPKRQKSQSSSRQAQRLTYTSFGLGNSVQKKKTKPLNNKSINRLGSQKKHLGSVGNRVGPNGGNTWYQNWIASKQHNKHIRHLTEAYLPEGLNTLSIPLSNLKSVSIFNPQKHEYDNHNISKSNSKYIYGKK